jgi:excisionase family DNA binding protein
LAPGARKALAEAVARRPERAGSLGIGRTEDLAEDEGEPLLPVEAEEHPHRAPDLCLLDEETLLRSRLVFIGQSGKRVRVAIEVVDDLLDTPASAREEVVRRAPSGNDEGRDPPVSRAESRPSESGRQDLNLRPLGPEGSTRGSDTFGSGPPASDVSETTRGRRRSRSDTDRLRRPGMAASVTFQSRRTSGTCRLLTVPEVAERLRVCRATVYRLVAEGRIPAVRISSGAIRVPSSG